MKKQKKTCPECEEPIVGRADKRFCSDQCRSAYNNRLNSVTSRVARVIDSILRKNRRVLMELNSQPARTMVTKEALLTKGFNFTYNTHTYTTKKGDTYIFCYEQGYLYLPDKNLYLLVTQRDQDE